MTGVPSSGTSGPSQDDRSALPSHAAGRRRWPWVAATLLAVALGGLAFTRSSYFAADRISVEGAGHLSEARVQRLAGLHPGINVFTLDTGSAERRLEADAWVADATVTKNLPDAIAVVIEERTPVAAIESPGGWEVLSADGVTLDEQVREPALPVVAAVVPTETVGAIGARVVGPMEPAMREQVATVTLGADGAIRLVLTDGVTVSYGSEQEPQAKAQALAAVLGWASEGGVRVSQIDVRVPGAPTARLASGATIAP